MNWGYKILFFYVVFVVGIMLLVFKSASQKVDLVSADYYEQELKYQQRINAKTNAQSLTDSVKFNQDKLAISVILPTEMHGKKIAANILMYCPSNNEKDFPIQVVTDNGQINFMMPKDAEGVFIAKLSWEADGKHYYAEHNLKF